MVRRNASPEIEGKLAKVSRKPGVYLMRDLDGRVLYVGKARSLRPRVRSYFRRGDHTFKTQSLIARITDFDVIVTDSEVEALLLENNLIKEHKPRFNVTFRDDKQYLYIKVTVDEVYPRVGTTRRLLKDDALYFGPYTSAKSVRQTLKLLNRLFPYRTCNIDMSRPIPRPCLKYDIGLCNAPCTRAVSVPDYAAVVDGAVRFLRGEHNEVVHQLTEQMWTASAGERFEQAALIRDRLQAIENVLEKQKVSDPADRDGQIDIFGVARHQRSALATVFQVRGGKMIGNQNYWLAVTGEETDVEMLDDFVREYYDRASDVPRLVLVPRELTHVDVVQTWLTSLRGSKVVLHRPQRGSKRRFVDMASRNAFETLQLERASWLHSEDKLRQALFEIGSALELPRLPRRIECYDVSHIQGSLVVGSLVVFEDGVAQKGKYRRFKVRGLAGNDDFSSLQQVLRRRFKRYSQAVVLSDGADDSQSDDFELPSVGLESFDPSKSLPLASGSVSTGNKSWGARPDLVLIDGGKGQLSSVLEVLDDQGLNRSAVPVAAIAKRREELFVPGKRDAVLLPFDSNGLHLLQNIRDEAHRFAVGFHVKLRTARGTVSVLDDIPGIGSKRKRNLLRVFGSLKKMKEASLEQVATVDGMTRQLAKAVKEAL